MNLLLAEWSRLVHRRFVWIMVGLLGVALGLIAMGFVVTSTPPTDYDHEEANRLAAAAQVRYDTQRAECLDVERGVIPRNPASRYPPNCDYGRRPQPADYLTYGFVLAEELEGLFLLSGTMLCLFAFLVGASFVGAEWTSGGLTNLLLWRPNRMAVLGAKLAALVSGVFVASVGYLVAWIAVFWLVAVSRGWVGSFTGGAVVSLGLTVGRVVLLVLALAVIGFALASLGRHTATALGVLIGYLLVYELGTLIVAEIVGSEWPWQLRLSTYVAAWLVKRMEMGSSSFECGPNGCFSTPDEVVTWVHSGIALGMVVVALVAAAFLTMRRRDVA